MAGKWLVSKQVSALVFLALSSYTAKSAGCSAWQHVTWAARSALRLGFYTWTTSSNFYFLWLCGNLMLSYHRWRKYGRTIDWNIISIAIDEVQCPNILLKVKQVRPYHYNWSFVVLQFTSSFFFCENETQKWPLMVKYTRGWYRSLVQRWTGKKNISSVCYSAP